MEEAHLRRNASGGADRLGDEKTRGRLSAYEKTPTFSPHPRRSLVVGVFNPGGARRWLMRTQAAHPCRVYSLLVQAANVPDRVSCCSSTARLAARVMAGSRPPPTLAGCYVPAEPARLYWLHQSSCDTTSEGLPSCCGLLGAAGCPMEEGGKLEVGGFENSMHRGWNSELHVPSSGAPAAGPHAVRNPPCREGVWWAPCPPTSWSYWEAV